MPRAATTILACLAVLAATVALIRAPSFANFVQDDGFIYFRIASNVAHGAGPVFNAGERVDAATSPVWLWLLALAATLGLPLPLAAAWLGLAAWGATIVVAARWAFELQDDERVPGRASAAALGATFVGALALLLDDRFILYAFSGLETMLCACTWTWALRCLVRRWLQGRPARAAGIWVLLASLVRPEFVLFVAGVGLVALLRRSVAWREMVRTLMPAAVGGAVYVLAHTLYFGDPLPNTYYAKRAGDWAHARIGLHYVATFPRAYPWLGLVLVAFVLRRMRGVVLGFLAGLCLYALQVASLGGDHFEFYRAFLYVLPAAAAIVGATAACLVAQRRAWRTALVAAGAVAMLAMSARPHVRENAFAWVGLSARLGAALASTYPQDTRVGLFALGAAGYTSRLPVVDALWYADRHVARRDLSHEHVCALDIGHERGDPEYMLQHADVVVFFAAYAPVPYESLDEVREGFYSHKKFLAAAATALQRGTFRLRNIEFMPGAYWAVLERAS